MAARRSMPCERRFRPARSRAPRRSARWRSSPTSSPISEACTPARWGTSASAGTSTWRSHCAPSSSPAATPTCRRAPGWSPTRSPSASSKRPWRRPAPCSRRSRWPRSCDGQRLFTQAGGHRQLRLVHIQPCPVPRRAGGRAGRLPQRCGHRLRVGRLRRHRHLARPWHARRRGHLERGDQGAFRPDRDPRRLPRPPVPGPGVWRSGRAQRAVAWQDLLDPPRQLGRAGGRRRSVRSDQVSLFDRGTGITASRAGGDRMDNRRHGHGTAPYAAPDLWRPVPSRVGAHQGRQEDPGQLHQAGHAVIEVIAKLVKCESLSEAEAAAAFETIMRGDATPVQIAGFMVALRMKGESVEELTGFARTARALATPIEVDGALLDTCGTGGDGLATFNISTLAAIVAAACGAKVAKHGNRAASSLCGSADVLEQLGVKIDLAPDGVARCIEQAGIGFLFAPIFHPSFRFAGVPRRELGLRTVFNVLGPLCNPAGAKYQALGVADGSMASKMADVLIRLGVERSIVFHAGDGMDELSVSSPSHVIEIDGSRKEYELDPRELGLAGAPIESMRGGGPEENARIAQEVLAGAAGPRRDVVLLNSAAALRAAGLAATWKDGLGMAAEAIDSGRAGEVLQRWAKISQE